ncbi:sugar ABC transporter substrate-binding protein [Anaerolineales bacterium HSG6]|nr:sugar ABC transporter substrate-binding protein [Anaerolineales bacterium HSG6]MDM8531712.1 sugar ABC transporter substrate-binding protein [Anaerolineales bacterium HSG25]
MYSILKISILSIIIVLLFGGCNSQPPPSDESSSTVVTTSVLKQKTVTKTRIVFVTHEVTSTNSFWAIIKRGADQAAKDFNITVEYHSLKKFDMALMAQLIEEVVATNPDGLVVSIPDEKILASAIKKAVEADIPVISINAGQEATIRNTGREATTKNEFQEAPTNLGALTHVGQLEYEAGIQAGERLAEAGVRHGFCVNHWVGNLAIDARCEGFTDAMLSAGGIADTLAVDPTKPDDIQQRIDMALETISDVDGILTNNSNVGIATLKALKKSDLLGKVKLATFDLSPQVIEAIQNKEILFAVDQQQYLQGYLPVMLLYLYLTNRNLPVDKITPTGPEFVTIENVAAVIEAIEKGTR